MVLGNREAGQVAHCGQADCYGSVTQTIAILCSRLTCETHSSYFTYVAVQLCSPVRPARPIRSARGPHAAARPRPPVHAWGACPLVTRRPGRREGRAETASAWTETRAKRGVTVHDHGRRLADHLSRHTSPVGTGRCGRANHCVTPHPPRGVRSHAITDVVTAVTPDAGTLTGTRNRSCPTRPCSLNAGIRAVRPDADAARVMETARAPAQRPTAITEPDGMATLVTPPAPS
jgi:hypothetical protein